MHRFFVAALILGRQVQVRRHSLRERAVARAGADERAL